ncbi:MAG: hypothetical protein RL299_410 [Pseudomonadota bacterium]|jgi:diacylglycerol kinase
MLGALVEAVVQSIADLVIHTLPKRAQIGCFVVIGISLAAMLVWAFGLY